MSLICNSSHRGQPKSGKEHKSHGVTSCEINSSRHNAMYINTLRTNVMSDEFLKKIIYC